MNHQLRLRIENDKKNFQPLDTVSGTVEWSLLEKSRTLNSSTAEVHLLWHTEGVGTKDIEIVTSKVIGGDGRSPFSTHGSSDFSLKIPVAPYTYSGSLIAIVWEVEFVVSGVDEVAREVINVRPHVVSGDSFSSPVEKLNPHELF